MSIDKKNLRNDIPGHQSYLNSGYSAPSEEARRLVVGKDISLSGQIASCDHLVVEGTVQAATFAARRIDILDGGLFTGNADVQDAVIAGRIEGKLTVQGKLTVKSTGKITGEIQYGVMECEAGARIEGTLSILASTAAQTERIETTELLQIESSNENKEETGSGEKEGGESSGDDRPRVFRRAVGF